MTAVLEGNPATDTSTASVAELLAGGLLPGAMVVVPESAGGGRGWLMIEADGHAEQSCCAVVSALTGVVLAVGLVSEVKVARTASPMDAVVPPWAPELAGLAWKARRAEIARDSARGALAAHEVRLEAIVDAAHEYADDNNLCERFDEFMEEQGLRGRKAEYECEVDVTVRVLVKVTARDAETAEGEIDTDMLGEAISRMSSYDVRNAIEDHDVNEVCRA